MLLIISAAILVSFSSAGSTGNMENAQHYPDHFVVGISDLDRGMDRIEELTGVRPVRGGTHPHIGTRNALISLGEHSYLEIIAPDPAAEPGNLDPELKARFMDPLLQMDTLTPFLWAVGSSKLETTVDLLEKEGISLSTPEPGARRKPDGSLLEWKASFVTRPAGKGLPFYIQWIDPASAPPTDSPKGCVLKEFSLTGPDERLLQRMAQALALDVAQVSTGEPGIRIILTCPRGQVEL